jgi:hypothetical protein
MNAPLPRVLRSYQQRAATFLYERDAALLVAPLGAGKGAAVLTGIAELIQDGHRRHALVIAPKLVATTVWPAEIASWPHLAQLRVAVLDGSPARRRALLATATEREVTVIGVDLVPWLGSELAAPSSPTAGSGATPSCPGRSGFFDHAIHLGVNG